MFIVEVGALVTSVFFLRDLIAAGGKNAGFDFAISAWLWFTVIFANFAEAVAEGRGKAQADFLRRTKTDTKARRVVGGVEQLVGSNELRKGDVVRIDVGELIPGDGEVVEGAASVDESANRAAIARRSPAERACSPTTFSCASPRIRGSRSWTA
jgi:K+-transporting ATPase ATPase B chain